MEAVDGMMRGLWLTEKERRGVKIRVQVKERGKTLVAQAVGKVMSEKLSHPDAIRLSLGRVWCPIKGIECKEVGENLFVFTFNQESGERMALEDGPCMFEKDLVVVEDHDPGKRPEDYEFNEIPIWVGIFSLPLGMMNADSAEEIRSIIGSFLEADVGADGVAMGKFLRVKIRMNIDKPIMRGFMLDDADHGGRQKQKKKMNIDGGGEEEDGAWYRLPPTQDQGKEGYAAIKADMRKAYYRVEWRFLEAMLLRLGFGPGVVQLIMRCVTTMRYQIKVNGDLTEQFRPIRGLRQGDPMSSYLFVICTEGLSALLQEAEGAGRLSGVKICNTAPTVSHLFFADDFVLLMKVEQREAEVLKDILDLYERCSGQCINKEKSVVMFSPNTKEDVRTIVKDTLGIQSETWNDKYLGLPVHVGRSRRNAFAFIKGVVAGRVYGPKEKLIAKAGKETLVKAVARAIPTYAMSCFYLTKTFCEELSSLLGKY
uniref:Reverse transcriptase domain-containing protein n=1 Tax=Hordeum vulgare subsp. vulgare TaxID=112509 RepID=A0A8I6Y6V1_HORVV